MDSLFHGGYYGGGYYDDGYSSDEDDDCWWRNDPRFEGYSRRELEEDILFLRPDYNAETDEFASEGKNISWCIDNGFEEVEDGVWSGPWYWRRRGGEEAREKRLKLNASRRQNIQLQRESAKASLIRRVDDATFARILRLKEQGNSAFKQGDFPCALTYYQQTHEQHSDFSCGMFLEGAQREEKVKILSNQAECHLRLKQYDQAQMAATEALTLDKSHEKSLIRRAKATYHGYTLEDGSSFHQGLVNINPMAAAYAQEDLEKVIRMGGSGVEDAQKLCDEINAKLKAEIESLRTTGMLDSRDM